jgi:hypothetical protein
MKNFTAAVRFAVLAIAGALSPADAANGFHAADLTPVTGEVYGEGEITLVAGGEPKLPIYVGTDRYSRRAAEWLRDVLVEMSGAKIDITIVKRPEEMTCDRSGVWMLPRVADPGDGSFEVKMGGDRIVFAGSSPDYGLYDFCERVLGVRMFFYDEAKLGWDIPKSAGGRVAFRPVSWKDRPVYERRDLFPACVRWEGPLLKMGNNHLTTLYTHAPHKWHTDTNFNYKVTNPEVLELASNGARGATPMLCYGSPKTVDEYLRRIAEEVAGGRSAGGICTPARKTVTVCQWDAGLNCHCGNCKKLMDPELGPSGSGSPIIWNYFTKELSRRAKTEYPDWKIITLPYLNTCAIPEGLDFDLGNVEAMLCTMPGLAMLKNRKCRESEEKLILDWEKVTHKRVGRAMLSAGLMLMRHGPCADLLVFHARSRLTPRFRSSRYPRPPHCFQR